MVEWEKGGKTREKNRQNDIFFSPFFFILQAKLRKLADVQEFHFGSIVDSFRPQTYSRRSHTLKWNTKFPTQSFQYIISRKKDRSFHGLRVKGLPRKMISSAQHSYMLISNASKQLTRRLIHSSSKRAFRSFHAIFVDLWKPFWSKVWTTVLLVLIIRPKIQSTMKYTV